MANFVHFCTFCTSVQMTQLLYMYIHFFFLLSRQLGPATPTSVGQRLSVLEQIYFIFIEHADTAVTAQSFD